MSKSCNSRPRAYGKWLNRLCHLAVLVIAGTLAWRYIDFPKVGEAILSTPPGWVVVILLMISIDRFLMGFKWWFLLRAGKVPATLTTAINAYYQAGILQRFLPSSLGGDVVRGLIVTNRHGNTAAVIASMIIEKLLGIVSATFLCGFAVVLIIQIINIDNYLYSMGGAGVLLLVLGLGFWLSLSGTLAEKFIEYIPIEGLRRALSTLYTQYLIFINKPRLLAQNIGLTVLEQMLQIAILTACAIAIEVAAPTTTIIAAIAISQFARKIVILLEGWMLAEVTNVLVCVALGISESEALAFSLLGQLLITVGALPGVVLFVRSTASISFRDLRSWSYNTKT